MSVARRRLPTLLFGLLLMARAAAHAAVEVNQASLAELEAVRGIGTDLAERIVAARQAGAFRDWRDLIARVRGLGSARAARLSADGLVVAGQRYAAQTASGAPVAPAGASAPRR